jgi:hypothetical protein
MYGLYPMIFKRKSIRKFDATLHLTKNEITAIETKTQHLLPLIEDIVVSFELVRREKTTARSGEFCLLLYSETKSGYLLNAGYLLEQMDLYFALHNFGACYYALAKPERLQHENLQYVMMIAFGKSHQGDFRLDSALCHRKPISEIWQGVFEEQVQKAFCMAPSACNTQPWRVVSDAMHLEVFRSTKIKSFIPASKLPYYNSIDMGISLCFLEFSLQETGYRYTKTIYTEGVIDTCGNVLPAITVKKTRIMKIRGIEARHLLFYSVLVN